MRIGRKDELRVTQQDLADAGEESQQAGQRQRITNRTPDQRRQREGDAFGAPTATPRIMDSTSTAVAADSAETA
jgi:hypothetical protein